MFHATQRVRRGAELLDRHRPGWEWQVDIEHLNLSDTDFCLLGQLYGDYHSGCDALGLGQGVERPAHGFNVEWPWQAPILWGIARLIGFDRSIHRREFRLLRDAWVAAIRERQYTDAAFKILGDPCRTRDVPVAANHSRLPYC
jgi:hypothetical protein